MSSQILVLLVTSVAVVGGSPSEHAYAAAQETNDSGCTWRHCLRVLIFGAAVVSASRVLPLRRLAEILAPRLRQKGADDIPHINLTGARRKLMELARNDFVVAFGAVALLFSLVEWLRIGFESSGFAVGTPLLDRLGIASCLEFFGLVFLRNSIRKTGSVAGISQTSVILYSLIYVRRLSILPPFAAWYLYTWRTKIMAFAALLLIADVIRCMVGPHRATYSKSSEKVRAWHIVLPAVLIALVYTPSHANGVRLTHFFTTCLTIDCFALLPQVVMMAWESCPVQAPIAHFVLATAFSRSVDLYYWTLEFSSDWDASVVRGSAAFILGSTSVGLLMVADFFYYYVKARVRGSSFQDVTPLCDNV